MRGGGVNFSPNERTCTSAPREKGAKTSIDRPLLSSVAIYVSLIGLHQGKKGPKHLLIDPYFLVLQYMSVYIRLSLRTKWKPWNISRVRTEPSIIEVDRKPLRFLVPLGCRLTIMDKDWIKKKCANLLFLCKAPSKIRLSERC